jgi:hypothetical protein
MWSKLSATGLKGALDNVKDAWSSIEQSLDTAVGQTPSELSGPITLPPAPAQAPAPAPAQGRRPSRYGLASDPHSLAGYGLTGPRCPGNSSSRSSPPSSRVPSPPSTPQVRETGITHALYQALIAHARSPGRSQAPWAKAGRPRFPARQAPRHPRVPGPSPPWPRLPRVLSRLLSPPWIALPPPPPFPPRRPWRSARRAGRPPPHRRRRQKTVMTRYVRPPGWVDEHQTFVLGSSP